MPLIETSLISSGKGVAKTSSEKSLSIDELSIAVSL